MPPFSASGDLAYIDCVGTSTARGLGSGLRVEYIHIYIYVYIYIYIYILCTHLALPNSCGVARWRGLPQVPTALPHHPGCAAIVGALDSG